LKITAQISTHSFIDGKKDVLVSSSVLAMLFSRKENQMNKKNQGMYEHWQLAASGVPTAANTFAGTRVAASVIADTPELSATSE